jgi:Mce-associated membrane protein
MGGEYRKTYEQLTQNTVIHAAREKRITAAATVPGVGVESLGENRHLDRVRQPERHGRHREATSTISTVCMGLTETDGKWLVTEFEPR